MLFEINIQNNTVREVEYFKECDSIYRIKYTTDCKENRISKTRYDFGKMVRILELKDLDSAKVELMSLRTQFINELLSNSINKTLQEIQEKISSINSDLIAIVTLRSESLYLVFQSNIIKLDQFPTNDIRYSIAIDIHERGTLLTRAMKEIYSKLSNKDNYWLYQDGNSIVNKNLKFNSVFISDNTHPKFKVDYNNEELKTFQFTIESERKNASIYHTKSVVVMPISPYNLKKIFNINYTEKIRLMGNETDVDINNILAVSKDFSEYVWKTSFVKKDEDDSLKIYCKNDVFKDICFQSNNILKEFIAKHSVEIITEKNVIYLNLDLFMECFNIKLNADNDGYCSFFTSSNISFNSWTYFYDNLHTGIGRDRLLFLLKRKLGKDGFDAYLLQGELLSF